MSVKQHGTHCNGCGNFFWAETLTYWCPDCDNVAVQLASRRKYPHVRADLEPSVGYVGARKQLVRSRYHLRELFKAESDRMHRDLRIMEGD